MTEHDEREELITSRELAAVFGCHQSTVSQWVKRGRIRAIRTPGGNYRFLLSQVLADLSGPREGKSGDGG